MLSDLFLWIVSGVGTVGCVYLLYLNDWNLEKTLYGHTLEEEESEVDTL